MRPDRQRPSPAFAGWPGMVAFAVLEAVVITAFFAWRDGFGVGDVLAGLVIGALTLAVLAVIRRTSSR